MMIPVLRGSAQHWGGLHSQCRRVARHSERAAVLEALADAETSYAKCVNEHGAIWACQHEIREELREAIELAEEVREAQDELCSRLGHGGYCPEIDPAEFSSTVTNSYFPLVPGRTLVYEKMTPEGLERIEVTTLSDTIEIDGVECAIVKDVVTLEGEVVEDTDDWYAQHANGDVWYIGEISMSFEDGLLDSLEGSWRLGKDGAKPGIIMLANPMPGDIYRQEYLIGEAEDVGEVVALGQTVNLANGMQFTNCAQTLDYTPLEPDAREWKFYAPGVGLVLEVDVDSGERTELVQIIN